MPRTLLPKLAAYAARAVKSGRLLCGQDNAKDVLSPSAQRRHGFQVARLTDVGDETAASPFDEPSWNKPKLL